MTSASLTRRRLALAFASLPFARAAFAATSVVEVRYVIERAKREPSGDLSRSGFEGALLMRSGETREADVKDSYRVKLTMSEAGELAHVRISVWDNQRPLSPLVGQASADVPIGSGSAELTLLSSDNIHYPIRLTATRHVLP